MYISAEIDGVQRHITYLEEVEGRMRHLRPVFEDIFTDMLRAEAAMFSSGGRRGGGSWKRLAVSTVRQKGHDTILVDQGFLKESVTERNGLFQVKDITEDSVGLGTSRPWWYVHQYGSDHVPQREFLRFEEYDLFRWEGWIQDYFLGQQFADPTAETAGYRRRRR